MPAGIVSVIITKDRRRHRQQREDIEVRRVASSINTAVTGGAGAGGGKVTRCCSGESFLVFTADAQTQHLPCKIEKKVNVIASRLRLSRGKQISIHPIDKMTAQARRARLPPTIRRKIQKAVRYFVFVGLSYVVLYEGYRYFIKIDIHLKFYYLEM